MAVGRDLGRQVDSANTQGLSGIIGSILALGLHNRNINVKVYEQARTLREIGAGIAFTKNARKCMSLVDSRLPDCVACVATVNGDPANPNNNMQFLDGYTHSPGQGIGKDLEGRKLYRLYGGPRGFEGCHRAHFLEKVMELIPSGVVHFQRRLESIDQGGWGRLLLTFSDGSTEEVDAVIGCDGIKSRVRQLLFGPINPISYPHYTHKIAYRGLVPMDTAIARLGLDRARTQHMYGGPAAHVLTFPVAKQALMNIVAFVADPTDWPLSRPMAQPATKAEVAAVFADWGPTVRAIVDLLPPEMDKWGVFDHLDYPAPTYSIGRVCLAGDAAHASSPHHGAGAGIGVEDTLALSVLLDGVARGVESGTVVDKAKALEAAFAAFSSVRHERSQWLVQSSREACDIYEWKHPDFGADMDRAHEEITRRSHRIWYFDIEGMLEELEKEYQGNMAII
ncbi:FAD-dependent oxidoreductase [Aspergillus candidus]|uniref:FAD/NAD(P)-binding domain-containing protein n=1 Tax=Aspergillus candidus TaxID=41067 RepID=A0A2I2FA92_ASPCN|nr:FAD/NAD(P)-binding domain-containing protein [Aspergillus candidus]PLB37528.1 FAD/NAD(P)-binding domain-containing protein [Aspergillus candidus]